jgi:hypothetical protein
MKINPLLLGFGLVLSLHACKSSENKNANPPQKLQLSDANSAQPASPLGDLQGAWVFTKVLLKSGKMGSKDFQQTYTLNLGSQGASLKLDVNNCQTEFKLENKTELSFGQGWSCTKMCCDDPETIPILSNLKGKISYSLDGQTLHLESNQALFTLKQASDQGSSGQATPPLYNTQWKFIAQVKNNKTISYADSLARQYKLSFTDNRISLKLELNQCGCDFALNEGQLLLHGGFECTEKCCDSMLGNELAVDLGSPIAYRVEGNKLIFYRDDHAWHFIQD